MSEFKIRDYIEKDFVKVEAVWDATGLGGAIRGDNIGTIAETIKLGGRLIVLENIMNSQIIGTSWLTIDGRRTYLHHFGILPEYQKKGLARLLLKESLKYAKIKGLQIKIEVHKKNHRALKIYKEHGFKYLGNYIEMIIRNPDKIEIEE